MTQRKTAKSRRPRLTRSIRFGAEWSKIEQAAAILARRTGMPVPTSTFVRSRAERGAEEVLAGASSDELRAVGAKG